MTPCTHQEIRMLHIVQRTSQLGATPGRHRCISRRMRKKMNAYSSNRQPTTVTDRRTTGGREGVAGRHADATAAPGDEPILFKT